ncbi:hypothetical protein AAF712_016742, partial [Marasmius tenuissimus]
MLRSKPMQISDTQKCPKFVSPRTGGRLKLCPYNHIKNGVVEHEVPMVRRGCGLRRRLLIPQDPDKKWFILEYSNEGADLCHNHPVPILDKVSSNVKAEYKSLVKANGSGMSQRQIEKSPVTSMMLGGKTPSEHSSALVDTRTKREIILEVKKEQHPTGLGLS